MQNQGLASAAELSTTGFITYETSEAIATITLNRGEKANAQTLDVQDFHAAIQSVFEIHQNGHGHALSESGLPILMQLDDMNGEIKKQ